MDQAQLDQLKKTLKKKYKNNKQQLNYRLQRKTKDQYLHWIFHYKFKLSKSGEVSSYLFEVTFYDRQVIGVLLPVCPFPFFDFQVSGQDYNKNLLCRFDFVRKIKMPESEFKTLY